MTSEPLSPLQVIALDSEVHAAITLSRRGIDALWSLDGANDFVHLPLQLLAQGLERLLKLTYGLAWLKTHNELPSMAVFKNRFRHDLVALTDATVELVSEESGYTNRVAVQEDLEFLRHDQDLRSYLRLLSTFGTWSRYYRFEQFLGASLSAEDDPDQQWSAFELEALRRTDGWEQLLGSPMGGDESHRRVSAHIAGILNRFARAITRMWTLGGVHEQGRVHVGTIRDFLMLNDEQLGVPHSS